MIAINLIRAEPHYRRAAFDAGLKRLGYNMVGAGKPRCRQDLLVLWNLQGGQEIMARDWENNGGTVLVCENAYLEPVKNTMYAVAVHGHNGSGWFPVGEEDRFAALGVEPQPWRPSGDILICGQRGIGSKRMASPLSWEDKTARSLKTAGHKDFRVRRHPGRYAPETTLEQDLETARLCVIWSSSSGVKALTGGVAVAYAAPHWICSGAARPLGETDVSAPFYSDETRLAALRRMAHAQWRVDEIEAGEPFRRILDNLGAAKW